MGCKKITVRFDGQMYDQVRQHPLSNSDLIRKSVRQYFRSVEPNKKISSGKTVSYDQDLVESLNNEISFLRGQVTFLQKQNSDLSCGWLGRFKLLLQSKKESSGSSLE